MVPSRMLRSGPWKYCHHHGMQPQLFNLQEDPGEFTDLAATPDGRKLCAEFEPRALEGWDADACVATLQRHHEALPYLRAWVHTSKPAEPDPPWFSEPLPNRLDRVEDR